jgi:3-deoxy-D-manno-octulosonate 8-phosphate phosphatase (KDO 8-P phosphatase)
VRAAQDGQYCSKADELALREKAQREYLMVTVEAEREVVRRLCDKIACMAEESSTSSSVLDRARKINLLLMDIDGTLTDGGVCLLSLPNDGGVAEMKVFNSQDGVALKLAKTMGMKTGFITGRRSAAVSQRAKEMQVDYVYLGQATKTAAFVACVRDAGISNDEVAYMGDDLPDMPVARLAGLAIAVANATPELKAISHYVTKSRGGSGTAREVVELILKAQGRWEEAIPLALA